MPRARKTWAEKMKAKPPHHVVLDKAFAGIRKGSKLHISCPVEVAEELKSITPGSIMSIQAFRRTGSTHNLAPFGRVVESSSPMAKKLNFDPAWIDLQQELEKQNIELRFHSLLAKPCELDFSTWMLGNTILQFPFDNVQLFIENI